jgi:hypothetical protein
MLPSRLWLFAVEVPCPALVAANLHTVVRSGRSSLHRAMAIRDARGSAKSKLIDRHHPIADRS